MVTLRAIQTQGVRERVHISMDSSKLLAACCWDHKNDTRINKAESTLKRKKEPPKITHLIPYRSNRKALQRSTNTSHMCAHLLSRHLGWGDIKFGDLPGLQSDILPNCHRIVLPWMLKWGFSIDCCFTCVFTSGKPSKGHRWDDKTQMCDTEGCNMPAWSKWTYPRRTFLRVRLNPRAKDFLVSGRRYLSLSYCSGRSQWFPKQHTISIGQTLLLKTPSIFDSRTERSQSQTDQETSSLLVSFHGVRRCDEGFSGGKDMNGLS